MQLKQGTLLQNGEYRIEEVLGQSGFVITYMAEQVKLNRKVEIKEFFMKEYCNRDEDTSHVIVHLMGSNDFSKFKQKFVTDAENFKHNNITMMCDVFEENNTAYCVMECMDSDSLYIKSKPNAESDLTLEPSLKQNPNSNKVWKILMIMVVLIVGIGGYFVVDNIQQKKTYGSISGHEWVDLGLPSGLKWATCNVGADNPEDYGLYFAWGEINQKKEYMAENSKTEGGSSYSDIAGDKNFDAARANWGGSWRLPTKADCEELVDECTWKWTTQNGVRGYKVTGPNDNSIFLPAAGYCVGSSHSNAGEFGYYWTSVPYGGSSSRAYGLLFRKEYSGVNWGSRRFGRSVRPVSD